MSQAGIINVIETNPSIPIYFDGNTGSATAIGNTLIIRTANSTVEFIGSGNVLEQDFGIPNLALGSDMPNVTIGVHNVFYGLSVGDAITVGENNVGIGYEALQNASEASDNVAIGFRSMQSATVINANSNVAVGSFSLQDLVSGNDTVALGYQALSNITTGGSNVAVGYRAGINHTTTESFNILIGYAVSGDALESNTTRIGGSQSRCFIDGITGVTVAASAPMGVSATDQLSSFGFGTSTQVFTSNGPGVSPSWQAAAAGGVTSVSGTANRITSSGGATPVIDIDATYVGQSSITTLGTITTGVWNGTAIITTYGGTGLASYTQGDLIYYSSGTTFSKLAKDANATRYLSNTGTTNNPAWAQVSLANGVTGNLPVANLNSGTSASSTTFWRGDGTWGTPAGSGGTVTSVTGTANRITSSGGATPAIDIDAAYVGQTSITTLGTIATGIWSATAIGSTKGGTGFTTYATGDLIYASGVNTLSKLTAGSNTNVLTLAGGVPTWAAPATAGTVTNVTGTTNRVTVATGTSTPVIDISGSYVGQSSITTLGTITAGVWTGTSIALANGGTSAALTASNGGIFYSTASAGAILAGTATANKVLMSGASTTPSWSTPTFPNASATTRKIIVSDGTNWTASTETYAVPGTSGNILTSDGTNWTSAAASGGSSYALQCGLSSLNTPADSTTYYMAPFGSSATTISGAPKIFIPKTGTIRQCYGVFSVQGTLGTSENITIAIRLNDTTNTNVTTTLQATAIQNPISNAAVNMAVTAGDYITFMVITPAWATNPTTCQFNVTIFIS